MNRRAFLGFCGAVVAVPMGARAATPEPPPAPPMPRARRATTAVEHDRRYTWRIAGVAVEDVRRGDLVEVQTAGPVQLRVTF